MPDPADEVLARLVERCRDDPRIVAVLLLGSRATGQADAYSDVDIGLVTTDGEHAAVVADLGALAATLGEVLFAETFGSPENLHLVYADGVGVELIAFAESELAIDGPHRILFDRADAVARSLARAAPAPDGASDDEVARQLITWFWHDVEHFVAAIGRRQWWWAFGQLDELRRVCLNLARLTAGGEPEASEAYWKVEAAVPAGQLRALEATVAPLERGPMLDAADAMLEFYRALAVPLAAARGIGYPGALDRLVSRQVQRLRTAEPTPDER
jgi:predicted nucleotidyltransferase